MKTEVTELAHYRCDLPIAASPATVYAALTTPQGLRGWWTNACEIGTVAGSRSTFRFDQTYKVMQIESLQADREVRWQCVGAHIDAPDQLTRTNEWIGTRLIFRLVPQSPAGTLLRFEHIGLTPKLECYEMCVRGWDYFLASLKCYAESGKGSPYVSDPVATKPR